MTGLGNIPSSLRQHYTLPIRHGFDRAIRCSATECPRNGHVLNLSVVHTHQQMVDQNYITQQGAHFLWACVPLHYSELTSKTKRCDFKLARRGMVRFGRPLRWGHFEFGFSWFPRVAKGWRIAIPRNRVQEHTIYMIQEKTYTTNHFQVHKIATRLLRFPTVCIDQ